MKKYFIIATVAVLAAGCNQTEEVPADSNIIRIEAGMTPKSRATLEAFEAGDRIGIYAVKYEGEEVPPVQVGGNSLNNEPLTYDGTAWNAGRTLYWDDATYDFYGIYPYQDITTMEGQLFDLATDQSTAEVGDTLGGYEYNDLLWAKTEKVAQADGTVHLAFNHMMSRLVVQVVKGEEYEGDLPTDMVSHVYNTATTAKVYWQKGSLEKYLYSETKTIKMRPVDLNKETATFDAIIVPQFIERSTPLVEITMQGIAYLLEYSMSFRPGYQHTLTVTLNTSPDQEKIEIDIDGDISEDWTDSTETTGGV